MSRYSTDPVVKVHYRIKITGAQDREELISTSVRLAVIRCEYDARGNLTGKAEKLCDPIMISALSPRGAEIKARRRATMIIHEDQERRKVAPTHPRDFQQKRR